MTPKERALAALHLEESDIVPVFEAWTSRLIVERLLGREYRNVWDFIDFCKKLRLDFVEVPNGSPRNFKPTYLRENVYVDEFGRIFEFKSDTKIDWYKGPWFKDVESYLDFEYPDPLSIGRLDNIELAVREAGQEYAVAGEIDWGIFERSWTPVGMERFLKAIYTQPSIVKKVIDRSLKFNLELAKSIVDAGVDAVLSGDDLADNHGPFMTPRIFREFLFEPLKSLVQSVRKRGVPFILHTDGNIYPILNLLIDAGIDGLHPLQPQVIDIRRFKEAYGSRICLMGNIDISTVLPFGTPQDVAKTVRACIEAAGAGGGYILSSSNSLHEGIPVNNIISMVDAAKKFGRHPINQS